MKSLVTCLILTFALLTGASEARAYKLIGEGTVLCGSWTPGRQAADKSLAPGPRESWVMGFLSGIGYVGENGDDPLKGLEYEAVLAWIDNYCRANPGIKVVDAAGAFYTAHPH